VLLLFSVLTTVCGISLGLFANARKLGQLAADGELDAALALPVHPLAYLLVRRIDIAMLGDLMFGPVLFVVAGAPTPERIAVYIVASLCGAAVMVGFMVALGALTLFVGGRGEQADLGFQAILILASYPVDLFAGATKLLLFTAVPAAFVTGLPTALVDEFRPGTAVALVAAAAAFLGLGLVAFQLGLRRYASGAVWTKA
jgi:ABC-2 type transport system permease protein